MRITTSLGKRAFSDSLLEIKAMKHLIKPAGKVEFAIKMTPLIDVIFLLMIFFVMTLNVQEPEGFLENRLPDQTTPLVSTRQIDWEVVRIHVAVEEDRPKISLQKRRVNDLTDLLRNLDLLPRDILILIDPEAKVAYKHVIGVYDTCLKSKKSNIVFSVPRAE